MKKKWEIKEKEDTIAIVKNVEIEERGDECRK